MIAEQFNHDAAMERDEIPTTNAMDNTAHDTFSTLAPIHDARVLAMTLHVHTFIQTHALSA